MFRANELSQYLEFTDDDVIEVALILCNSLDNGVSVGSMHRAADESFVDDPDVLSAGNALTETAIRVVCPEHTDKWIPNDPFNASSLEGQYLIIESVRGEVGPGGGIDDQELLSLSGFICSYLDDGRNPDLVLERTTPNGMRPTPTAEMWATIKLTSISLICPEHLDE